MNTLTWAFVGPHRPHQHASNAAMIYAIGPQADQTKDPQDFLTAVRETGHNLFRALHQYNKPAPSRTPIDFVRVCLVSVWMFDIFIVVEVSRILPPSYLSLSLSLIFSLPLPLPLSVCPSLSLSLSRHFIRYTSLTYVTCSPYVSDQRGLVPPQGGHKGGGARPVCICPVNVSST